MVHSHLQREYKGGGKRHINHRPSSANNAHEKPRFLGGLFQAHIAIQRLRQSSNRSLYPIVCAPHLFACLRYVFVCDAVHLLYRLGAAWISRSFFRLHECHTMHGHMAEIGHM